MMIRLTVYILSLCTLISCQENKSSTNEIAIDGNTIQKHLKELSSDKYTGRMPCTEGGELTVDYLIKQLKALNVAPGNGSSYTQDVPLLTIDGTMSDHMNILSPAGQLTWDKGKDFVIHTQRKTEKLSLDNSELVFCGYGIVDEKLGWNDYAGIDMKGKTAVVLVNDPGYGGDDPEYFKGDIMTYYGRWTYKYEEADRQGAAGLLLIHETSSAGYPWFVVQSSWTGPQQGLSGLDRSKDCDIKGWISLQKTQELFEKSGLNFTEEIKKARTPGFEPIPLNASTTVTLSNTYKECTSKNVIGIVKGTKYPDEYINYTAHWDHIGIGKVVEGDSIYNGALDNASGTAALLAIAEGFVQSPPERSVMFLFVTAEEQGLLGSEYYVKAPTVPLSKTVCNLNLDGVNPNGLMKDFTVTGLGHSQMDDYAQKHAVAQDRYVMAEQEPEKGYFFRSDHFNFAKSGVPALYGDGGYDHMTKGKEYAKALRDSFTSKSYHAPSDEFNPDTWQMDGAVQDAQIYYNIGLDIANSRDWPKWNESSEFKRISY
jgi:Zn-dependent M28 family amino/carboxypeptidase